MKNIVLLKKDIYTNSHRPGVENTYKPYYFIKNGKEFFIKNLPIISGVSKNYIRERSEMAEHLKELRKNNFCFVTFRCPTFENPIDFINYVIYNKLTFTSHRNLIDEDILYNDFSGNLKEKSFSFKFRIYDKKYLSEVKDLLKKANFIKR